MAEYTVEIRPKARAYLTRLHRSTRARIEERIDELAEEPFAHSKPLQGQQDLRSSRVGDYRLILEVEEVRLLVLILKIAPRGEVYRRLG